MSAKKENKVIPPTRLALYDNLIQSIPNLERKGVTLPYTSWNGHMFSFLSQDGSLGIRLPQAQRENFIKKYKTTLCTAHGTVLKEYAAVPEKLFRNTGELIEYFAYSFEYVKTLKPKPAKKEKNQAKRARTAKRES